MKDIQEDRATAGAGTGRHSGCAGFYRDRLTPLLKLIPPSKPPPCLFFFFFSPLPPSHATIPARWGITGDTGLPHHLLHRHLRRRDAAGAGAPGLPPLRHCHLAAAAPSLLLTPPPLPPLIPVSGSRGYPSRTPPLPALPSGCFGRDAQPPPRSYRIPSHGSAASGSPQATQKSPAIHCWVQAILLKASSAELRGCSGSRRPLLILGTASRRGTDRSLTQPRKGLERGKQALLW